MSTPHKFRVWDGEEMHEPPEAGSQSMPPKHFTICADGVLRKVTERPKGQTTTERVSGAVLFSTGLTDEEGTEIYEGDIIEKNTGRRVIMDVVSWDVDGWAWDGKALWLATKGIVVGNRYEDPILIEESTS